jgi:hypothetical protein
VTAPNTLQSVAHFLLVYDRASGTLVRQDAFADDAAALRARFDAEREFAEQPNIEIVALSAASEDELRRTHARYFLRLDELAARLS